MHPATRMSLIYNVNVQKSFNLTRRGSRTLNELAEETYLCDVANVQAKIYMILFFFSYSLNLNKIIVGTYCSYIIRIFAQLFAVWID